MNCKRYFKIKIYSRNIVLFRIVHELFDPYPACGDNHISGCRLAACPVVQILFFCYFSSCCIIRFRIKRLFLASIESGLI